MKLAIKNPAPIGDYLRKWGDYHFGMSLQNALMSQGVQVEQHFWPDWGIDAGEDVVLVLRGKRSWVPPAKRRDRQYLMWVLSHPADLTAAECDAYDRIYSASETHQRLLAAVTATPVGLMRQCTDIDRFFPPDRCITEDAVHRKETIFVGNSRNVRREIVQWAIDIGHPLAIYGREWERFGFKPYVRSKWVENDELPELYRQSRVCLNDHWHDMRNFGMISNRIFDALACGLPVISDHFPELEEVVGDAVLYAGSANDLRECFKRIDSDYSGLLACIRQRWKLLKEDYSFDCRVQQLLADLDTTWGRPSRPKKITVPRSWLISMERGFREQSNLQQTLRLEYEERLREKQEEIIESRSSWSKIKNKLDAGREEISALKEENRRLQKDLESNRRESDHEFIKLKACADQRRDEIEQLKALLKEERQELRQSEQTCSILRQELEKMLTSRSWRVSAPIRWLGAWARGHRPGGSSARRILQDTSETKGRMQYVSSLRSNKKQGAKANKTNQDGGAALSQRAPSRKALKDYKKPSSGGRVPYAVRKLEAKLWGGYETGALNELRELLDGGGAKPLERVWSAWALARWHHYQGDYKRSLILARKMAKLDKRRQNDKRRVLIEAEALMALGRYDEAVSLLEQTLQAVVPGQPDLTLALCAALGLGSDETNSEPDRLGLINGIYQSANLASIEKADSDRALALGNLTAAAYVLPDKVANRKVSIIMPIFNAESTIEMAVSSLLGQSWSNLELLAIDDCSEDNTIDILKRLAAKDGRVKVHRQPTNKGAYAARNAGLVLATGDFITTHDSDDWSHPQKIERHCMALDKDPLAQASASFWCRATRDLVFHGTERPSGQYLQWNHSSLMVRREAMRLLGGWDNVRVGADTELVRRLERIWGEDGIVEVDRGVPLSFALAEPTSLTRAKTTSAVTLYQGLRREYREAAAYWHENVNSKQDLWLNVESKIRPFPSPLLNLPDGPKHKEYDLLFVMDWNLGGGAYVSSLNYVLAARRYRMKVAVWHRRRPDLDLSKPLNSAIRRLAAAGEVDVISSGDKIKTKYVLVGYPPIYREPMENVPDVKADVIGVIVNQMADRLYSGQDSQYDPRSIYRHVEEDYGKPPIWLPISGHVRQLIEQDRRYEGDIASIDWAPLIEVESQPPSKSSAGDGDPVIGRHSRDHYTKWPTRPQNIHMAYCADRPCRVEIMGGADIPCERLGKLPLNWNVYPFNFMDTGSFLNQIDFFVHYPNEDYIEEFGRSVIEAMVHNSVCILPPRFESTFGEAAVYAEPKDAWRSIQHLWENPDEYQAQIARGLSFVREKCGYKQLAARLEYLEYGAKRKVGGVF